jgi:hypothetical protein
VNGRAVVVDVKGHFGYAVTKVVPNVTDAPATQADILSLRQQVASLQNQLTFVKAQVSAIKTIK